MSPPAPGPHTPRARDLLFLASPALWPAWPFLPVTRRRAGGGLDLGVLFDAAGSCGLMGYSSTVFLTNLFTLPRTLERLLALPRETFDTPEEVAQAGWQAD